MVRRQLLSFFLLTIAAANAGPLPSAMAQTEDFLVPKETLRSSVRVMQNPFLQQGLSLTMPWPSDLDQQVALVMRGYGVDTRLTMTSTTASGFGLVGGGDVHEYNFSYHNIPLCEYQVKALAFTGESPLIIGTMPLLSDQQSERPWSRAADVWEWMTAHTPATGEASEAEQCYWVRDRELIPTWRFVWLNDKVSYEAYAGADEIYRLSTRSLMATGKGRIYPNNVLDTVLQDFAFTNLKGNGRLESGEFVSVVDTARYNRAYNADNDFTYPPTNSEKAPTSEFVQTSAFTNASRQLEFFKSIGFTDFGTMAIEVEVHGILGESVNNALYTPRSGTSSPSITIGDGDGVTLKNLGTDSDVVSHELGHHVIYKSITQTSGESLVLHEGLADYFTFARTGNACLGESICPKGSGMKCAIDAKCLRTADNTFALGGVDLPPEAHFKSQFISGMLWSIRKGIETPQDADKIALKAVSLMGKASGYGDLVVTLLAAEKTLYNGKYCKVLMENFVARGLNKEITGLQCGADGANVPERPIVSASVTTTSGTTTTAGGTTTQNQNSGTASTSTSGGKTSGKGGICGVTGTATPNALSLSLLLLPLAACIRRKGSFKDGIVR